MSKVMVNESSLTSIGDAIRSKTGTTEKYKPSQMAAAIMNIVSGSGGVSDFSELEYAEMTSSSSVVIPDLSSFTEDFSKVVLLAIQSSSSVYLYLRGIDTERTEYPEIFYFGPNSAYSTPFDNSGNLFHLVVSSMANIEVYSNSSTTSLTKPFKGKLIMLYEEE